MKMIVVPSLADCEKSVRGLCFLPAEWALAEASLAVYDVYMHVCTYIYTLPNEVLKNCALKVTEPRIWDLLGHFK